METLLCWVVGTLVSISIYLILSRNLVRITFGIMILSSAVNLAIFTLGGLTQFIPAIIPGMQKTPPSHYANALPQALILTAIVIGFGVTAYALVLMTRAWAFFNTTDTDKMRLSETDNKEIN